MLSYSLTSHYSSWILLFKEGGIIFLNFLIFVSLVIVMLGLLLKWCHTWAAMHSCGVGAPTWCSGSSKLEHTSDTGNHCGHLHWWFICFPLHLAKQLNAGLHVSLFMNPVPLRVKPPRWPLQIASARTGSPGTLRSERRCWQRSLWTVTEHDLTDH